MFSTGVLCSLDTHTHTHAQTHAQTRSMFFCRTGSDKLFLIPSRVFPTSCSHNTLFCGTLNVPRCINLHHKFRKACINQPAQPTLGCAVGEHFLSFLLHYQRIRCIVLAQSRVPLGCEKLSTGVLCSLNTHTHTNMKL